MKTSSWALLALSLTGFVLAAACSKPVQEQTSPAEPAVQKKADVVATESKPAAEPPSPATQQVSTLVQTQTAAALPAAQTVASNALAQTDAITSQTQASIDAIKKLLGEKNWSQALKIINDLAANKLTPELQATVEGLKQQALKLGQEAAASKAAGEATKALGLPQK